ncbi:DNA methyltransferase, partial [Gluconobacter oxydans]|uniref:DNA methyltransferase n=1 Tax=Gluconobacter oxydans TaxID=442 RepID=UPI00346411D0
IHRGNALEIDWEVVCPPPNNDEEIFIAGNPPFVGSNFQTSEQKSDRSELFRVILNLIKIWITSLRGFIWQHYMRKHLVARISPSSRQIQLRKVVRYLHFGLGYLRSKK